MARILFLVVLIAGCGRAEDHKGGVRSIGFQAIVVTLACSRLKNPPTFVKHTQSSHPRSVCGGIAVARQMRYC